ncbi:hypothetical protein FRX31_008404 [Thalictrum thalictroides]|uniref:Uncharacterized protein n=1 Tax=Thalictrum thalictroides TaxID=46969 RepID=A0A7J6WZJ3_THATH|nr:hypothetical protein FRX31_008404 [Thalictrum thalictroides]
MLKSDRSPTKMQSASEVLVCFIRVSSDDTSDDDGTKQKDEAKWKTQKKREVSVKMQRQYDNNAKHDPLAVTKKQL